MWKEDSMKNPMDVMYYKAKDVYAVDDTRETLVPSFDLKLFCLYQNHGADCAAIVLAKMLLYGPSTEKNLYAWQTKVPFFFILVMSEGNYSGVGLLFLAIQDVNRLLH